ncbi:MAG: hypothetical protein K9I84_12540 [Leadbetterella sp.]|nr:hypothetical protein [Leadbetterella sp.]
MDTIIDIKPNSSVARVVAIPKIIDPDKRIIIKRLESSSTNNDTIIFNFKIYPKEEDTVLKVCIEEKEKIRIFIRNYISTKIDVPSLTVGDLSIIKGSIDITGIFGTFGLGNIKDLIEDIYNAITDMASALYDFVDSLIKNKPMSEESKDTFVAGGIGTVGGIVLATIGFPLTVALGLGLGLFTFLNNKNK